MLPRVILQKKAEEDIQDIVMTIAKDSPAAAMRFFHSLEEMSAALSHMPHIGNLHLFKHPSLKNIRSVPIKHFEKYLLFYRIKRSSIEIIRILHGARDLPAIFS